jgi:hypothetical protein
VDAVTELQITDKVIIFLYREQNLDTEQIIMDLDPDPEQ